MNPLDVRQDYTLRAPNSAKLLFLALLILGVIVTAVGFSADSHRTWGALLFNFFLFYMISLCGVAFSAMQDIIAAKWGRPIKRIHESFVSFLPFASLFFVVFLVLIAFKVGTAFEIYPWIKNPSMLDHFEGKNVWLQPNFMVVRNIASVLIILALSIWQIRLVLKRDQLVQNQGLGPDTRAESWSVQSRLQYWCGPVCVVYSICFSILAFDLLMSLAPTWFSTLWAAWLFAIAMQSLFATILLFLFLIKKTSVGQIFKTVQLHDVGKLMYGFTIFFAYLTYAHILTYWYGNVPEETEYFLHRMHQPWITIAMVAPIFSFLIPLFAMIPKAAKYTRVFTPIMCVIVLIAQWFLMLLVVMPEIVHVEGTYIPWIEAGVFLGVFGLFLLSVSSFAKRYPMLSVGDPFLESSIQSDH